MLKNKINLNTIMFPKPEDTISTDICLRGKIDTGYKCNLKCNFCYTKNNLNDKPKDVLDIYKDIDILKDAGIKEIEFSGGEPTIHPKWFDILKYASLYFDYVSVVSNGSVFYDEKFLIKSKQLGLNEILFSLHGWDNDSHIKAVGSNSAYIKIMSSLALAKKHDIKIRINCVVDNNFDWSRYALQIRRVNPIQVNFLPVNYWDSAKDNQKIDYNIISNKLKECIDLINMKNSGHKIEINVRYIPLCYMVSYEQYCVGVYQHIFDKSDWNLLSYPENTQHILTNQITKELMFTQSKISRQKTYHKSMDCKNCKYVLICDGIENELISNNSYRPVFGEIIKDVNFFRNKG